MNRQRKKDYTLIIVWVALISFIILPILLFLFITQAYKEIVYIETMVLLIIGIRKLKN